MKRIRFTVGSVRLYWHAFSPKRQPTLHILMWGSNQQMKCKCGKRFR